MRIRATLIAIFGLLVAGLAVMVSPAVAQAATLDTSGSLVFIRGDNVWVAAADGSQARRLTSTGTPDKPFSYPSESDTGRILAIYGNGFVVLDQTGRVLHSYAQPLVGTGVVSFASISPDGTKASYTMTIGQNHCDVYGCSMDFIHSLYYLDVATGRLIGDQSVEEAPTATWVSNSRTVMDDGNAAIRYQDQGFGAPHQWFGDCDDVNAKCTSSPDSTYWHLFPTVNQQGDRYASVVVDLKYAGPTARTTFLNLFDTANFSSGTPAAPTLRCTLAGVDTTSSDGYPSPAMATIQTPTWSPNGRSLAASFKAGDGTWATFTVAIGSDPSVCPTADDFVAVLANAKEPRWSRAALAQPTRTLLSVSPRTTGFGHSVTLRASVTGSTGSVRFLDGTAPLGTAPVINGIATLKTARLATGRHQLKAAYLGTASWLPSSSRAVSFTVAGSATSCTLGVSRHTIVKRQRLVLTAHVHPSQATGRVAFYDGSTRVGLTSLSAGTAVIRISTLGVGTHRLRAAYLGSGRYINSHSGWVSVRVTR